MASNNATPPRNPRDLERLIIVVALAVAFLGLLVAAPFSPLAEILLREIVGPMFGVAVGYALGGRSYRSNS